MLLETLEDLLAGLQVVGVAGGSVQEVGGLNKLGTQEVLAPVNLKLSFVINIMLIASLTLNT